MGSLRDFLHDRGFVVVLLVIFVLLIVSATLFVLFGHATFDEWRAFATWVFAIFAGSATTHQVGVAAVTAKPSSPS